MHPSLQTKRDLDNQLDSLLERTKNSAKKNMKIRVQFNIYYFLSRYIFFSSSLQTAFNLKFASVVSTLAFLAPGHRFKSSGGPLKGEVQRLLSQKPYVPSLQADLLVLRLGR